MEKTIKEILVTTSKTITDHIIKSEGGLRKYPYLDTKGNVTIGPGFKTENEEQFLMLNLNVDGRPANEAEKRDAWKQMQTEKKDRNGDFNRLADIYKDITRIRMDEPTQRRRLGSEIKSRIDDIKRDLNDDAAWDKLSGAQKAAIVDVHYTNGSLKGFPKLKEGIREGDVEKMSRESLFFTDKEKGERNEGRLWRNYQALTGRNGENARKEFERLIKGEIPKTDPGSKPDNGRPPEVKAPEASPDNETPDGSGNPSNDEEEKPAPGSGENDAPGGSDNEGGSPGSDGEGGSPKSAKMSLDAKKFVNYLEKPGHPAEEALLKGPDRWNRNDITEVSKYRIGLPLHDPRAEQIGNLERKWYEQNYGKGPAEVDATGRIIHKEIPPFAPKPEGNDSEAVPLKNALSRIGRKVASNIDNDGSMRAIKGLQHGLNLFAPKAKTSPLPISKLLTDGIFGPKTRTALKQSVAGLGSDKIEEGLALGRFHDFAKRTPNYGTKGLGRMTENAFGPLFRNPRQPVKHPTERLEATSLQESLNDLGGKSSGFKGWTPLKMDGQIGPKTQNAFGRVLTAAGPDRLTRRFGKNLGFL
jgi:GH24 family phage-related lysozyme (muramidase)